MLHYKREGEAYPGTQCYEPKHPARWCKLKYLWTVLKTGNMYGPYGEIWSFGPYDWTCYIRWKGMRGYFPKGYKYPGGWLEWFKWIHWTHCHRRFHDSFVVQQMVAEGMADDPFIGIKYALTAVELDGARRD